MRGKALLLSSLGTSWSSGGWRRTVGGASYREPLWVEPIPPYSLCEVKWPELCIGRSWPSSFFALKTLVLWLAHIHTSSGHPLPTSPGHREEVPGPWSMEAASGEGLGDAALGVPRVRDWLRQLHKPKGREIASGVPRPAAAGSAPASPSPPCVLLSCSLSPGPPLRSCLPEHPLLSLVSGTLTQDRRNRVRVFKTQYR